LYPTSGNKLVKTSNMVLPFKGLESKELTSFLGSVRERTYPAGKIVFMPGDTSNEELYILKKGLVNLYRLTASGKRLLNARILPGEIFGVRAILGGTMQGNFAEAAEDSSIYIITKEQMLRYLKSRPNLMLNLLETACSSLYVLEERFFEVIYSTITVRLAHFLLNNADPDTGVLNMTHEDIGDIIGAVRQTVTETLSLMRKRGILMTSRKQIQIIDRSGLEGFIMESENGKI
ncbi:Crp/Fnr family transcriptional regulator, partial [Thermodesulfobacteriota bacterium]